MQQLNAGQSLIADLTTEAANAWARTMQESWKSYNSETSKAVIVTALAKTIKSIATTAQLRAIATQIINEE